MELQFIHAAFEEAVRAQLNIYDRPITAEDALSVMELPLSGFDFLTEDKETIAAFRNLKTLAVNIGHTEPAFWENFPDIEELYIGCWGDSFDFRSFENMTELSSLTVSGGDVSCISYLNLDTLIPLKKLTFLELHEFGSADLLPLGSMPQLEELYLGWAKELANIDIIGDLAHLKSLALNGLYVDDLDFLDRLPDALHLEMIGNHVRNGVDPKKWKRFAERYITEITVGEDYLHFVDLSALKD